MKDYFDLIVLIIVYLVIIGFVVILFISIKKDKEKKLWVTLLL